MDNRIASLRQFLDGAKSVFHSTELLKNRLEKEGYQYLSESENWKVKPGGKYYMTRGGAALIAFRVPEGEPSGFMMAAGHSDRPTFKVKENPILNGKYQRLAVEPYGGMLMSTWLDRPLSVAGRVMVEKDGVIETKIIDIDRDLLLIPNVAIHMNRGVNQNQSWNPAVDLIPLMADAGEEERFLKMLEEIAGGKILGHDLYLYVRQKASVWGLQEEFISSAAVDDLTCVFCALEGFLAAKSSAAIPLFCAFDSEEVGSCSMQGAGSNLLELVMLRICRAMGWQAEQMLGQSFMVSADNGHAIHPNHPEYADPNNAPVINSGIVLKFNANQRYTTDGVSAAVFRKICEKAGAPTQTYCNRADIPGGSTLGHISMTHVSIHSVDVGLPQLSMHSCYETAGVKDILSMMDVMTCFYSSSLHSTKDGSYQVI